MKKFGLLCAVAMISLSAHGADGIASAELQQKAANFYRAGKFSESANVYKQLAAQDPNDEEILKDLMWALWNANRIGEARDAAAQVTKLQPDDLAGLNMLAKTNQKLGNTQGVSTDSGEATDQWPGKNLSRSNLCIGTKLPASRKSFESSHLSGAWIG